MRLASKLLLTVGLLTGFTSPVLAQGNNIGLSGTIYSYGLSYDNSNIKKDGYVYGAYGLLGIGWANAVELGLEHTYINYKDNTDLNQNDFTIIYNNYSFRNKKLKLGYHYIDSDDINTDGGYTIILGAGMFEPYNWDINVDFYYTKYDDYVLPNGDKGLDVYQISPSVGFSLGDYYRTGKFYFETTGTYIRHSDDVGFGKNFASLEERIYYYRGPLTLSVFGWLGERSFMVDNGGFTVFNLKEKYKNGYGISASYRFNYLGYGVYLTASITKQQFKEVDNPKDVDIYVYGLQGGLSF